ncbi:ectoine/hydroxyectoine ABC transporter permease subunit EhuC [Acuticoccus mangrovi]|uniref:Ectoine/hydroxyectoine ABC transporter permease subunit EhuC n=1 Tax=Acuticoccus mangrovi TaxID=2796142 RepID=A0A934MGG7_9HYPH|nr:ectoine/hydroxyectoine ABC transporter permease subunit EhuC [Acuticoccus mangrovi]MBJ3776563.1 ectoine/hydroxyectoine ABC transporter permease subunit EhuC [Acuticoccus mangrovi]
MDTIWNYRWLLLQGLGVTVQVTVLAGLLALALGIATGLARRGPPLIAWPVHIYVEVFRGTSALVQLFVLFFVLPGMGLRLDPMTCGVVGLGLCYGAYCSEVVRGALNNFPRAQREAAVALNLTGTQTLTRVVLPQALLVMLPQLGNLMVELLKASSLVSLITLADLTFQARSIMRLTLHTVEAMSVLLVAYFVLAQLISFGARALEARLGGAWRGRTEER